MNRRRALAAGAALLVALALGAVASRGWRPWAASDARASCRAPAKSVIPEAWAKQHLHPESELYRQVFSPQARQRILGAEAQVPGPLYSEGPPAKQIASLRQGRLVVERNKPAPGIRDIDWRSLEHGRYYATQLHGLVGLAFLSSQEKPLGADLERQVAAVIVNWALCAGQNPDINPRAWYEGTVVKRLSNLLHALRYLRRTGRIEGLSFEELVYLIVVHADYLLDTPGIYSHGNHGIRQNAILAATALALPGLPRAAEMLDVAQRRLDEAAGTLFTAEGIWAEHAPGYVHYALGQLKEIKDLADHSKRFAPQAFLKGIDGSARYLAGSLTPETTIPWIGRSSASRLARRVRGLMEERIGSSLEQHLSRSARTLTVYPGYGHAVFRGEHPDGLYLIFHAGQNLPAGKRDEDALSFILFNHGRVWVTEGGHAGYEKGPMTTFLNSPLAHNTYVHGDDYVRSTARPELSAFLKAAGPLAVEGFSERFPTGASARRTVSVAAFRTVQIHDQLAAPAGTEATVWRGFLHFPGDLAVQPRGDRVEIADPASGRVMTVRFQGALSAPPVLHSGAKDPLMGWGQTHGQLGPVNTVEYRLQGSRSLDIAISWSEAAR